VGPLMVSPRRGASLFADAADDEVEDDGGVDGHGVAAPARAEDTEVAAVDVEGGFEAGKVADSGHHAHADHFRGYGDVLRYAVDDEVAFDVVGVLSCGFDAGAAKGKRGEFVDVEEIVGAQHFVAAGAARVEAGSLNGYVDLAFRWVHDTVGQCAAEILKRSFFLENHPLRRREGKRRIEFAQRVSLCRGRRYCRRGLAPCGGEGRKRCENHDGGNSARSHEKPLPKSVGPLGCTNSHRVAEKQTREQRRRARQSVNAAIPTALIPHRPVNTRRRRSVLEAKGANR